MAADAWILHDSFKLKKNNGGANLDTDSFVLRLATSASNIATSSVSNATTVTNELSGNGYTTGGKSVATALTISGNTVKFDFPDTLWTADGGSLSARFAYLVDTTITPDEVAAHCLLDNAPADLVATNENDLKITTPVNGVFTE